MTIVATIVKLIAGAIRKVAVVDELAGLIDANNPFDVVLSVGSLSSYFLQVARGNVTGQSSINKFGRNIEVDNNVTADIWDGGHTVASGGVSLIWVVPTQARIHTIASTSASDTDGGVGARTVKIWGLSDWDTAEVNETVTLDTASPPVTANSYVIIHRMRALTKGATNINVGIITATAAVDGTITAQIRAEQGQTHMAVFGIPSTQKLYIGRLYGNINKKSGASGLMDMSLLVNFTPKTELLNFIHNHTFGLETTGTSALTINFYTPKVFEGPAILKIQGDSGVNDMDVSAGFDGILVNN